MEDSSAICDVTGQAIKTLERVCALTQGMNAVGADKTEVIDLYKDMRLDELEHAQLLVLQLTQLVSGELIMDGEGGSAFGPGELNYNKGETEDEDDAEIEEDDEEPEEEV